MSEMKQKAKAKTKTEYLLDALKAYDKECQNAPAGQKGLERRGELDALIIGDGTKYYPLPKFGEICEFYQKEKKSGLTEPRLIGCLRDALYEIFHIQPPAVQWGAGFFAASMASAECEGTKQELLDEAIKTWLEGTELRCIPIRYGQM